jgi:hypothetical protein
MFGNGTKEFVPNMFSYKIKKSTLCDYCKEKDAIVDYYLQTPSYYRNCSSGHYFMCSQECYDNYRIHKTCHKCRYGEDLIFIPEQNYSLCDNYPCDISCYDKEVKYKQFCSDNTAICSFCEIRTDPPDKYRSANYKVKRIDEDILLNVCNRCNKIYEDIVMWDYDKLYPIEHCCIFCKTTDGIDSMHTIERYDETCIFLCDKCHTNYKYLIN